MRKLLSQGPGAGGLRLGARAVGLGLVVLAAVLSGSLATVGCAPEGTRSGSGAGKAMLDFREVVRSAKDKVFPAVVYIKCVQESMERGKKVQQEIAGSGVIISAKGEVLTNWHVVEKVVSVRCLLYDGRAMNAKVIGTDKDTDLALLQLEVPAGEIGRAHV